MLQIPVARIHEMHAQEALDWVNQHIHSSVAQKQSSEHTIRETYQFGYDYFSMTNGDYSFHDIPPYLHELCGQCIALFNKDYALGEAKDYQNIIISRYLSGYCLEPHMDVDVSDNMTDGKEVNFYFGEDVLGIVLKPDEEGALYLVDINSPEPEGKHRLSVEESVGTVFLLNGKYRRAPYLHGVNKVKEERISITFRTVYFK